MKLFIANCSRQNRQVQYRLDFNAEGMPNANARFQPARQQDIPPGRQVQIGGDMHITQIEDIVQQLTKFGLVAVVDIPRLKVSAPTPMVFNVDKAVPIDIMRRVHHNNSSILIEQGRLRRERAAVAANSAIQDKVNNLFMHNGVEAEATDQIDVGFEQLDQSDAGESRIEEGFKIRPEGAMSSGKRPGGKGGKGRRG